MAASQLNVQTCCAVCGEQFKWPRMAPACGHSFCSACMKQQIDRADGRGFTCVVCGTVNGVTTVDTLPINVHLQAAMTVMSGGLLTTTCSAHPHSMNLAYCSECDVVVCKDECARCHPGHNIENLVAAMNRMKCTFEALSTRLGRATHDLEQRAAQQKRALVDQCDNAISVAKQRITRDVDALHKMLDATKIVLCDAAEHDLRSSMQRNAAQWDFMLRENVTKVENASSRVHLWLQSDESLARLIQERNSLLRLALETESLVFPEWQPKFTYEALHLAKLALQGKLNTSNQ